MSIHPPQPVNEMNRVIELSELDLDYLSLQDSFKDLTRLAAKIAGTEISLVNLIDSFTQWTVSNHGMESDPMPREESICNYTVNAKDHFEVKDLAVDQRFEHKDYVTGKLGLRYYFGIPLQTPSGNNLGALCVLDRNDGKELSPEKQELLRIIAGEIVTRLLTMKALQDLRSNLRESNEAKKKVAHDIRGPLGGIIGLANIISQQGNANKMEDVLDFINLIQKSSRSLLELAEDILGAEKKSQQPAPRGSEGEYTLAVFKTKLIQLYGPQAVNKQLDFEVTATPESESVPFVRNKLLQIAGNLISNAMKFTPAGGKITVLLDLRPGKTENLLVMKVSDTGVGMSPESVTCLFDGNVSSTNGTAGEQGYGFGLSLVKHLVASMKGTLSVRSEPDKGTEFAIELPMRRV
ncbi:GAF domain-containing sensor histidine kinase [Sediminibacterium soli]|uniref:GAF domain-containing sensor histidine kinase n=1 Tax=Sediminibacterium soli TaxID=2698829 RepID=UPI00137A5C11|nr:GAF domain-containing sensor histidine kinase [Sediminibacterium soli]NCI46597.1 GAF domain-containing sensor histidine kinase [Sediminibacterium soli]